MIDRSFSETDLRVMLESATGYRADPLPGRWSIETSHNGLPWEVIVELDDDMELLVVVTAFPIG